MKKEKRLTIQKVCILIGAVLLVGAILTFAFWRLGISYAEKQAHHYVNTLYTLIPEPQDAALEERTDNAMPVLSVDETDFVGMIEMPGYALTLPVGAVWGGSNKYPCRFGGSIYDGTLQIGATTQKGQFEFYRELFIGDTILYTDMVGNRYTFEIISLRYEAHADQAALQREAAPLTLFIKNIYSFEYLIVSCDVRY